MPKNIITVKCVVFKSEKLKKLPFIYRKLRRASNQILIKLKGHRLYGTRNPFIVPDLLRNTHLTMLRATPIWNVTPCSSLEFRSGFFSSVCRLLPPRFLLGLPFYSYV
jgi:hypothetical protein